MEQKIFVRMIKIIKGSLGSLSQFMFSGVDLEVSDVIVDIEDFLRPRKNIPYKSKILSRV